MKLTDNWVASSAIPTFLLIISASNFWVQYNSQWLPEFIASEVGIALLTIILPFVIQYNLRTKNELLSSISKIIKHDEKDITSCLIPSKVNWIIIVTFGLVIGCLGIWTVRPQVFGLPWTGFAEILFEFWIFIFLVGYSILFGLYFHDLSIIYKIKDWSNDSSKLSFYSSNIDIFYWPIKEIRAIYYRYFKLLIIAILVYLAAVIILWISPAGGFLAIHTNVGRFWVFPPAFLLIIYFLTFSFCIHSLLPKWKVNAQDRLKIIFENEIYKYFHSYSDKAAESIDRLLRWRDLIEKEDMKIFDIKLTLATIATILAPTARILLFPSIKVVIETMINSYARSL